jgi:hypothetical protein
VLTGLSKEDLPVRRGWFVVREEEVLLSGVVAAEEVGGFTETLRAEGCRDACALR